MVRIWVQSWNRLAKPIPRGAASLGAALGAERGWMLGARLTLCTSLRASAHTGAAIRSFLGDRKGRNYDENAGPATPRGYPRGGPQFHLAALPFPGLLRDGPPKARLRSGESAFLCHRQRRLLRPPLAVSIRGFLGGKNTESSPLNGVSFAAALSKCAGGTFVAEAAAATLRGAQFVCGIAFRFVRCSIWTSKEKLIVQLTVCEQL